MADASEQQRRYREFLDLMPMTLALAGLPESERGKYFNEDQIEIRMTVIRNSYKAARTLARELVLK